ncbi:hypothetical protein [Harryflintia acetispora]|uniref:hypothetical protein n=1 Tax=Harryflintia acetispora TaxID=1849041 RepID=UPI00189BA4F0|nr:hypothetical protein [Harryflintia acetispora]
MKKSHILLAALLACILAAGCSPKTPAPEGAPSAPVSSAESANESGADASSESESQPAEEEKPEPVYASQIKEGTYKIEVSSSSSMFRIVDAQLTVAGAEMSALLTLSGTGYEKLYPGTAEQALADTDEKCIYFVENEEGKYTYQVPVPALNVEVDCAAWSIRKEQWYDRTLVFQSDLIPQEAVSESVSCPTLPDGQYTVQVTLAGGTGRTSVESPAVLRIEGGKAVATLVWSSPYYEFMKVDGTTYNPLGEGGNSTFEIPVTLDEDMAVSAQTVAMSQPHEIEYTLHFDSATLEPAAQ